MINLLPPAEKNKLLKIYRLRIGVLVILSMLVMEMLAALVFLPPFYVLDSVTANLADDLAQKRRITPEGETTAQQELAAIKKEIAILKPGTGTIDTPPSVIFTEIFSQKPNGISINTINYARSSKNAAVQISGHAQASEDMLTFQKNLKENPRIASTQYANNNFIIQKTDVDFTMTISLK